VGVVKLPGHGARIVGASSVGSENLKGRIGRRIWEHNIKTDTKLTTYDNMGLVWFTLNQGMQTILSFSEARSLATGYLKIICCLTKKHFDFTSHTAWLTVLYSKSCSFEGSELYGQIAVSGTYNYHYVPED
jgi:hypothetical protein